ncbi:hypothetical protein LEN26_012696 [Aphanomyces euteiches]|nr:hypothetical protein AeMF1_014011 [Aphanomyces euteiches]KAH9117436.1 hypothetical protein LEN26_012696 [Aphanomyces euteiches]KAH9183903.1 hypothetical protein AeNC1_014120 [Aphanomyces euteiches]
MAFEYAQYFTDGHRVTLEGLRDLMGDDNLAIMLSDRPEQHLLNLVEVIGRYADSARVEEHARSVARISQLENNAREMENSQVDLEGQILSLTAAKALLEESLRQTMEAYNALGASSSKASGHENGQDSDHVLRWLLQVSLASEALNITEEPLKVAFAMSHLQRRAEAWANSLRMTDPHRFPTFDAFADQLKEVFLPPNSDFRHRSRYLSSTQGKSTIREFVQELRYLYACITDEASLPEATRVTVFMNGLNKGPARTELFRQYLRLSSTRSISLCPKIFHRHWPDLILSPRAIWMYPQSANNIRKTSDSVMSVASQAILLANVPCASQLGARASRADSIVPRAVATAHFPNAPTRSSDGTAHRVAGAEWSSPLTLREKPAPSRREAAYWGTIKLPI